MTLVCKPKGRGNWNLWLITVDRQFDLLEMFVGATVRLNDKELRVVEIRL